VGSLSKRLAASAASWRARHERQVVELLSEREAIMNEIALRARIGALPPMLAKARTLLTRFWARANWQSRAELLPAARMLLVLGAAQSGLKPARPKAPGKRRAASGTRKAGTSRAGKAAGASRPARETTDAS
jgi:hypothetical protein